LFFESLAASVFDLNFLELCVSSAKQPRIRNNFQGKIILNGLYKDQHWTPKALKFR